MGNFIAITSELIGENIWIIISYDIQTTYYGGFMKFDANGNMLLTKLFANPKQATLNLSFLQTVSITAVGDSDIAVNGRVLSLSSSISYSNDSSTDQVVFRINQSGDIVWTTVLDYQLGYDATNKMTSYGSTIYSGIYANMLYPCFFSLIGSDGSYKCSNCYTFFFYRNDDEKDSQCDYATANYVYW